MACSTFWPAPTSAGRWPKLFLDHAGDRLGRRADRDARRPASAATPASSTRSRTIFSFVWNPGRTLDDLDDTVPGAERQHAEHRPRHVVPRRRRADPGAGRGDRRRSTRSRTTFDDNIARRRDRRLGLRRARRRLARRARRRPTSCRAGWCRSALRAGRRRRRGAAAAQLAVPAPPARHPGPPAPALPRARRRADASTRCINPGRTEGDPAWHFRVEIRSDAGASVADLGRGLEASATAATSQVSVGWSAVPNESGRLLRPAAARPGTRLELGPIAAVLTLSGDGSTRPVPARPVRAIVIDGASADGFMRKLLGGRPIRASVRLRPRLRLPARLHPRGAHAVVHRRDRAPSRRSTRRAAPGRRRSR